MSRKNRNYRVDEVMRSLTAKGCVITLEKSITERKDEVVIPTEETIGKAFVNNLIKGNKVKDADELKKVNPTKINAWFEGFKKHHPKLFLPRTVTKNVVVQEPFTVNIRAAVGNLGNGSWGKIDFLIKHSSMPFTLLR